MAMSWTAKCNNNQLIPDISKAFMTLSTSYTSMGSPQTDYVELCSQYEIRPCPFVTFSLNNGVKVLSVFNGSIDISSWRAMLLAIVVSNPPVEILRFHGSELTDDHVADLKTVLDKRSGTVTSLKLDYVSFLDSDFKALSSLLGCNLPYISFCSCQLPDSFLSQAALKLPTNIHLQALNLNGNAFTDEGLESFFKPMVFNVMLKYVSLKRNMAVGPCLEVLGELLTGRVCSVEDLATMKNASKAVSDKNKTIKDGAKARKAAGQPDIPDLPLPDTRVVKAGPLPTDSMISNRGITLIDLSGNPFQKAAIASLVTKLSATEPALITATPCSTNITMKGVLNESDKKEIKTSEIGKGINLEL